MKEEKVSHTGMHCKVTLIFTLFFNLKEEKKKPTEACKRLTVSLISIFTLKSFQRKAPFLQLTLPGTELSGF